MRKEASRGGMTTRVAEKGKTATSFGYDSGVPAKIGPEHIQKNVIRVVT